jgi:hypothetical protein
MRKVALVAALALVGALSVAAIAFADHGEGGNGFQARLDGYAEAPMSISSTGHGRFKARLVSENLLVYELEYAAVETPAFQAHIHFGSHHEGGGVSAFLCGGGDKPPCPPTAGEVRGEIDPTDVIGPASQGIEPGSFDELIRAMRAGDTYVNVHTSRFTGGEIRGQINDRHNHGGRGARDDNDDD